MRATIEVFFPRIGSVGLRSSLDFDQVDMLHPLELFASDFDGMEPMADLRASMHAAAKRCMTSKKALVAGMSKKQSD